MLVSVKASLVTRVPCVLLQALLQAVCCCRLMMRVACVLLQGRMARVACVLLQALLQTVCCCRLMARVPRVLLQGHCADRATKWLGCEPRLIVVSLDS